MEHLTHILTLLSATAAGSLIGSICDGVVLAAGISLCLRLVPRITAAARSVVWTVVLLLVVLLHFTALLGGHSTQSPPAHETFIHIDVRWTLVIACLWTILSIARGTQLIRSAIRLRRIAKESTPVDAGTACTALLYCGGLRSAMLCISTDVDRPSVVGFFSLRILLPPSLLENLSAKELEQIIMHEMEHLRRADDWTNLLQKISLMLFPLNPVLLWVERRLCIERELACDDRVLHATGARKAYATCLTNLAEHSILRRGATLALGAWERQSELTRRVHHILRRSEEMGRRQVMVATSTLVLSMLVGAVALAHCPQLVSFAPLSDQRVQADVVKSTAFPVGVYRESTSSPTLVKAVMPKRQSLGAIPVAARTHRHNFPLRNAETLSTPQPSWFVLTEWRSVLPPSNLRLAVPENARSTYAAVPMENGWLIIQL